MAAPDPAGFIPFMLDRYSVLCPLGQGGMAEVFLAEVPGAQGFAKLYTIKRIKVAQESRQKLTRMLAEEAHLTHAVAHPNVVQVFELQDVDGQLFLVLEFVDGGDLFHLLQSLRKARLQLPWPVACHVLCCVLRGLHHAHRAVDAQGKVLGLVHRDVTPSNVLISRQGSVKLADFGVALARARLDTPEQDAVMGKPAYLAPEAVQRGVQDAQGDVWGAGVVLWETLTARRLFVGVDVGEQVRAVVHGPIPPPSVLREDIPPELDALVALALHRDPTQRFPDARTFELALYALIRDHHPDELAQQLADIVDAHGRILSTREIAALPRPRRSPTGSQVAVLVPREVTMPSVAFPPPTQSGGLSRAARLEDTQDVVVDPQRRPPPPGPTMSGDDFFAPLTLSGPPQQGPDTPRQVTMDWPPAGDVLLVPEPNPALTPDQFLHAYEVPAPFGVEMPNGVRATLQATELYDQMRAHLIPAAARLEVDHVHRAPAGPVGHQLLVCGLWQAPVPQAVPTAHGFFPQEITAFSQWARDHAVGGLLVLEQLAQNRVAQVVLRGGNVDLVMDAQARDHPLDAMRDDALDANGVLETVLRETIIRGRTLCDCILGLGLTGRPRLRQLLDQVNLARLAAFLELGPCRFAFHLGAAPPLDTPAPTLSLGVALKPPRDRDERGFDSF